MGILRIFLLIKNGNCTDINSVSFQIQLLKIFIIHFHNCDVHKYESIEDDNESTATEETEIAKANEQINPGDVISTTMRFLEQGRRERELLKCWKLIHRTR